MRNIIVALVLLVAVLGGALALTGGSEPEWITREVVRGDLVTKVTASGKVRPVVNLEVGSQLSGQIAELMVDFNDPVSAGQAIARIDPQAFAARARQTEAELEIAETEVRIREAALLRAKAGLRNARAARAVAEARLESAEAVRAEAERAAARAEELRARAILSEGEVDAARLRLAAAVAEAKARAEEVELEAAAIASAEAGVTIAEAEIDNARAEVKRREATHEQALVDLERTVIRSPIDGVVISRDVDRGQTVAASLSAPKLFVLAEDLSRMEVHARIDEADIGQLRLGQKASFTVEAYPRRRFEGDVVEIRKGPETFQNVVTYAVVISAENPDELLLPGMTTVIDLVTARAEDVPLMPAAALRFRPPDGDPGAAGPPPALGRPAIAWVERDGEAVPVAVGLGAEGSGSAAILAGPLVPGDRVIVGMKARESRALGFRLGR